jgi:hypothetical protein
MRANPRVPRQAAIRAWRSDHHEHDAAVIRDEVVSELSELVTTAQRPTDVTRPPPAPPPGYTAAGTTGRPFQPWRERPHKRGRPGGTDGTRERRLPNSRIDARPPRQRRECRSRLSPTAQSLLPQAESPVLPTGRASNAGRRLFAGLRRLAARTQRVHRPVHDDRGRVEQSTAMRAPTRTFVPRRGRNRTRVLSLPLDGKEGVDGSSPSEGSAKAPHVGAFSFRPTCL